MIATGSTTRATDGEPPPRREIVVERVRAFRFAAREERLDTIFDRFAGMPAAEVAV